jgi:hypothetical protein
VGWACSSDEESTYRFLNEKENSEDQTGNGKINS